ncbi:MAG: SDR family NAD(P)-dependent oxidoreductase [SAR324 cluster bacterium]|nr:SDR family NAD(P)-dependent oxidoreductase [SAR324 cluster bacterium]
MTVNNNMNELETIAIALSDEHSVEECAVQIRQTNTAERQIIAFVVLNRPFAPERLHSYLQTRLAAELLPAAYVPLSALPLTDDGQLDDAALSCLPILDDEVAQQWEQRIQALPEINQVAVVMQEKIEKLSALPLSGLLPDWKTISGNAPVTSVSGKSKVSQAVSDSKKLALSYSGPLTLEADAPKRLSDILERAAQNSEHGVVYVQSDGSEQFQSYPDLLGEARRILTGLRKQGLKPQDKVIFQIEPGRDFIPAFWGCILGGFIPVPISIAPTYKQINNVVTKIHHAWQMLEHPLVLTDKGQAQNVRSLSTLLNIKDFRVETVDHLKNNEPAQDIHESQLDDLTLLLLTSGSTGMPKAVMLNHRNLLSMSAGTVKMNGFSSQDVTLNWMPLDHVGAIVFLGIVAVDSGCKQIHVPTDFILKNPLHWLELIERHRASVSWAPNFAFSLINERAGEISQRQWDLSSMGFLVNAGEQIVAKTARKFLKLLQSYGMPSHALRPAFGMSETCSGITWSEGFTLENSSDDTSFVELGGPIPGASLRIVDDHNQIVAEGTIGRFQVKGPSVTVGYYKNPERNREQFTEDGWFNTGDLGYLQEGHLVLTGRDKDDIIINGVNFYSHEIEAVVEELEHLEISYTAACAVHLPGDHSDKLAVFFVSPIEEPHFLTTLIKKIRGTVAQKVGIRPDYLIPVKKETIPKTAIGKIQRSQLSQRFQSGEFDLILQQFGFDTPNSLPDWFYHKIWRKKSPAALTRPLRNGQFLIFADTIGLGKALSLELSKLNQPVVTVDVDTEFTKIDNRHYRIAPDQPDHYRRLMEALTADGFKVDQLLHLWTYDNNQGAEGTLDAFKQGLSMGGASLLNLVQALGRTDHEQTLYLLVVSNNAQNVFSEENIAFEKAPVLGLIKTISQERPDLECHHVDFSSIDSDKTGTENQIQEHAAHILREIRELSAEPEVAFRNNQRWITRLEKRPLLDIAPQTLPFKKEGTYLISGGLGGIGVEIAKYLLTHYNARLLLIGRTRLPERDTWASHITGSDDVSERLKAYQTLESLGGTIIYQAVDVCELESLQQALAHAKAQWNCELDGIIHLAGTYHEQTLMEETPESFSALLSPKVLGTWNLHQLIKHQPGSLFINFSSVNSFFGGAAVGAFSAASRFLESFSHYQNYQCHLRSYCFHWSLWGDTGMNRHSRMKDTLRAHGYYPITAKQGLVSLLIGLRYQQSQLFIGLDGNTPHLRRYMESDAISAQKLTGYFTTTGNDFSKSQLPATIPDRFQTPTECHFVQLPQMPLTDDGAIDRIQLAHNNVSGKPKGQAVPGSAIEQQIAQIWQTVLGLPEVGLHENFFEIGGHSLLLVQTLTQLEEKLGIQLSIVDMFNYPTIASMARHLSQSQSTEKHTAAQQGYARAQIRANRSAINDSDIAVIGMACRFPGAENLDEFWQNLKSGVESIDFFTAEEIIASGVDPDLVHNPDYVRANPILSDIESFDAAFFGFNAREVELMDPQQRLLLECSWECMEDAGYNPITYEGLVGVYAGAAMNTYLMNNIYPNRHKLDTHDDLSVMTLDSMGGFQLMVANDKDYLTTRVSYKLNLRGPSVNLQTACSTSLLTIHAGVQSLQTGECDIVLAGGVSIQVPQKIGHLYQEGMIVTPDGHCRAFDARAEGTIFGSGAGMVALKRLKDALADGDQIYGVIKGSAVNNDGGMKLGYLAPSGEGQAKVAAEAMAIANITADTVTYVETHGTGTIMGDPIEVGGLTQAFRMTTDKTGFCAIGSVKTNVGHLQIASGIVGFIKTMLMLQHRQIPPSLHFENPNPNIDFAKSPFYVSTKLSAWETNGIPRRAGVNSLGIGGANVHVILEEAPAMAPVHNTLERPQHLLTLSAKSEAALQDLIRRYDTFLSTHPETSLADICFTANTGRVHFDHRIAVVAQSSQELRTALAEAKTTAFPSKSPVIAFLFTGQGSQYVEMGRQLYETQPTFRKTLDRCDEILRDYLEQPLLEVLYPSHKAEQGKETSPLDETAYTQPALFALEYALAELWQSWGIKPAYVMGHSVGEYVAACVAGVFSLEDGLKLIAERGRLMQALPRNGEMVAVFADKKTVATALQPYLRQVSIAALNGPENIVISGQREALAAIIAKLETEGIKTNPLTVSHAFHSPLIEPMVPAFSNVVEEVTLSLPGINLISNLTGELASAEITTPEYWCQHITQPVNFAQSMATLHKQGCEVFVEIGPKPVLLGMGHSCLPEDVGVWLPSLRKGAEDWQQLLQSLGELYGLGAAIDWTAFDHDYQRRRVALPTYPFQRQRYWIDRPTERLEPSHSANTQLHPLLDKQILSPFLESTVFETFFHRDKLSFLADHLIYNKMVVSGSCYISMILEAAEITFGVKNCVLEDVLFEQPLIIPDEGCTVQLAFIPDENHKSSFKLISSGKNKDRWLTHVSGKILTEPRFDDVKPGSGFFAKLLDRCSKAIPVDDFFQSQRKRQIDLGPAYQWIESIRQGNREAICRLIPPEALSGLAKYQLHPGLIDGGFELSLLAMDRTLEETYVPFRIEKVLFYQNSRQQPLWGHCQLQPDSGNDSLLGDIRLFDEQGNPAIEFLGFEGRKVDPRAMQRQQRPLTFCVPEWVPSPLAPDSKSMPSAATVILIYPADVAQEIRDLSRYLAEAHRDATVYEILLGKEGESSPAFSRQGVLQRTQIQTNDPSAIGHLLEKIEAPDVIYFFAGIYDPLDKDPEVLKQSQEESVFSLFRLVQALNRKETVRDRIKITVITTNAWQVYSNESLNPYVSSVTGFSKSVAREFPDLETRCVDVSLADLKNFLSKTGDLIVMESSRKDAEEIALRDGIRYVKKLLPISLSEIQKTPFKQQGVYLIVGGAGGIGLALSEYLASAVQARLIWVGRSKMDDALADKIAQIEKAGGKVLYIQADVTNSQSMRQAVETAKSSFGPINGAIHSALVLRDSSVMNMNEEILAQVLAPKVNGSVFLHRALAGEALDFMMFFSSIQSFLGNQGQSNYAAASTFEDSFAQYLKQKMSYPVKVINWGYWGNVGVVASEKYREKLSAQGIYSIEVQEGMQAIERALENPFNQLAVVKAENNALTAMGIELKKQSHLYPEAIPSVVENFSEQIQGLPEQIKKLQTFEVALGELEAFSRELLLAAYQRMGVFKTQDERYTRTELRQHLGIQPDYDRLFDAHLDILTRAGVIEKQGEHIITAQETGKFQMRIKEDLLRQFPSIQPHLRLLGECIAHYPAILRGETPATNIMFPDSSPELVEGIYKKNVTADYFNTRVAESLRLYVEKRLSLTKGNEAPIRILEIGAGTGGTTSLVLEAVKAYSPHIHYVYTDISPTLIQYGKKIFGEQYPFMTFSVLDIEKDLQNQGYKPDDFDIVLAANVLHATKRIRNTLTQIKSLLKRNGVLIINELSKAPDFVTLTFGLLKGWWLYEDEEIRLGGGPLLNFRLWNRVLEEEGYAKITNLGDPGLGELHEPHQIVIAESNGVVAYQKQTPSSITTKERSPSSPSSDNFPALSPQTDVGKKSLKLTIEEKVTACVNSTLGLVNDSVAREKSFLDYGVDSLMSIEIINKINKIFGIKLKTTALFNHGNVQQLSDHIYVEYAKKFPEVQPEEQQRIGESPDRSVNDEAIQERTVQDTDLIPVSRDGNIPLSFSQHRYWLHQTANPGGCFHNFPRWFRLTGKLDIKVLQQSLNEIVHRHEILRTTFPVVEGSPVQSIAPTSTINITITDLRGMSEQAQTEEVKRLADEDIQRRAFDLVTGPLLRVTLIRLAEESHILLLCVHHIVMDVWSMEIFLKELTIFYKAIISGVSVSLPGLPIQYADYAVWQQQSFSGEALETKLNYWRNWLGWGEPPLLELPADRPRQPVPAFRAGTELYELPSELVKNLKNLNKQTGTTLFTSILSALTTLLYRYSGCKDIVVGSPFANRNQSELEHLIGMIGSTLLLRLDFSENPGFSDLLRQAQQVVNEAISNQDLPFEQMSKILQPERKVDTPLFRILLSFFPMEPSEQFLLPDLTISSMPLDELVTRPDLALLIWEKKTPTGNTLRGWWRYRKDLFDAETVLRIIENFQSVLEEMVLNPDQSVSSFPMLM